MCGLARCVLSVHQGEQTGYLAGLNIHVQASFSGANLSEGGSNFGFPSQTPTWLRLGVLSPSLSACDAAQRARGWHRKRRRQR